MTTEQNYLQLVNQVSVLGDDRETRNHPTRSLFAGDLVVPCLSDGFFPVLQGRKMFIRGIVGELATFLQGPKDLQHFKDNGCNYWDLWAGPHGNLNVDYGNAWIDFNGHNQLGTLIDGLKNDPNGRRHLITGWRPDHLDDLSLPCCHYAYQWYVTAEGELEMLWHQRSTDVMIGLPSDIILAALWNLLVAQTVGLKAGTIKMTLGDTHIYKDHLPLVHQYAVQASIAMQELPRPKFWLDPNATVFNFTPLMFQLKDYEFKDAIKFNLHG